MLHQLTTFKRVVGRVLYFAACATIALNQPAARAQSDKPNTPAGDWRGMSICQVKPSGCNDEDSLYHFRTVEKKPGTFELQADKIISGKPITMGTSQCTFDAAKSSLTCVVSERATLIFEIKGDEMQGVMKRDTTIWRKLNLKRVH